MDIFYVKFAYSDQTDSSLLSPCIQSLVRNHFDLGISDIEEASQAFEVGTMSRFLAKATKVYSLMTEFAIHHNNALKLHQDAKKSELRKETATREMIKDSQIISKLAKELADELDTNPYEVGAPVISIDSSDEDENSETTQAEKLVNQLSKLSKKLKNNQRSRFFAATQQSNEENKMVKLNASFEQTKQELMKKRHLDQPLFSLALQTAARSYLITPPVPDFNSAYEPVLADKTILSVFDIHALIFFRSLNRNFGLRGSTKPDDITVVVTKIDEVESEEHSIESLKANLNSQTRQYALDLMKSAQLWIQKNKTMI